MERLTHPGGLEITKRAFDICGLPSSAKVLDIGCGSGDTAAYLNYEHGFAVIGIDKSAEAISQAKEKHPGFEFMKGDGQSLDIESRSIDCVMMECALSLMANPVEAVHEAFCVLKDGGYLIIHDLYIPQPSDEELETISQIKKAKAQPKEKGSCCDDGPSAYTIGGALVLEDINTELSELGFETILFEDRKSDMESYAASLIMDGHSLDEYCGAGRDKSQISYFLLVARKSPAC